MTHLMKGLRLPHLMKQIRAACSSATDESSIPATTILKARSDLRKSHAFTQ